MYTVQYQKIVNISTCITKQHQTTLRHKSATKQTSTFDQAKSRVIIVKTFEWFNISGATGSYRTLQYTGRVICGMARAAAVRAR